MMSIEFQTDIKFDVEYAIITQIRKMEADMQRSTSMKKRGVGTTPAALMRATWLEEKKQRLQMLKDLLQQFV